MVNEKGYAKVNLGLEVVGKREDGYHELLMVMTTIDLYDELYFQSTDKDEIIIDCSDFKDLPVEKNLIYQAAKLIKARFNIKKGVKVKVVKRIPPKAGLGGGSADAAATLRGLNKLWGLGLTLEDLAQLGLELGSDVPFCIYNKTAKVSGRGEVIEFIEDVPFGYVIVVYPNFNCSTKEVFSNYNYPLKEKGNIDKLITEIKAGDLEEISKFLYNDLEKVVDSYRKGKRGDVTSIKDDLITKGAFGAVMSGSGSAVYGITLKEKHAIAIRNKLLAETKVANYKSSKNYTDVEVYRIRSGRRSKKKKPEHIKDETIEKVEVEKKPQRVGDAVKVKAYGRVMLSFHSEPSYYKVIESPIGHSVDISIYHLDSKDIIVIDAKGTENHYIVNQLKNLFDYYKIENGIEVLINHDIKANYHLFGDSVYLAYIVNEIIKIYDLNSDEVYRRLPSRVLGYSIETTFEYNSRKREVKFLKNIPFSYGVVVSLGYGNLNNEHTRGVYKAPQEDYLSVLEGLENSDYYQITSNVSNSLDQAMYEVLKDRSGIDIEESIATHVRKSRADNFILSADGRYVIIFCRKEKQAKDIQTRLDLDNLIYKNAEIIRFKSDVSHKAPKREELQKLNYLLTDIDADIIAEVSEIEQVIIDKTDKIGTFEDVDLEVVTYESILLSDVKVAKDAIDHLEGIRYIASPGSLFKKYDFQDITYFFKEYLDGISFNFIIDDEDVIVRFTMANLPHIMGLHLIDMEDKSYRGELGVRKLLSGEIEYDKLKKDNKVSEDVFRQIVEKTQSAVLVLRDIRFGQVSNIDCYHSSQIRGPNSQMAKLKYGLARKQADNTTRHHNLVGIGYDDFRGVYFFNTSYQWNRPVSLSKNERLSIKYK